MNGTAKQLMTADGKPTNHAVCGRKGETMRLSPAMTRALRTICERKYCAHWLIHKGVLRALLRRRLIVPCGFYSVCLPCDQGWTMVSYAHPERAFDDAR